MWNKDVLKLIALHIDDHGTWYSFALVNKMTAQVIKEITQQRSMNLGTDKFTSRFFKMPLDYIPTPSTNIVIGYSSRIGSTDGPILHLDDRCHSHVGGKKVASTHQTCFIWGDGTDQFNTNGHKTFNVLSTGRGGEGIRFNNGAEGEMYSKRYNGNMAWVYKPKNPEHWGGFAPPTNLAEACDRLAAKLNELSGPIP